MKILGISCFYHDSAAALILDGNIVAAAQEERFTRVKHDASFPGNAAAFCLKTAGITADQLDYVVFYEKPLVKFDRLLETYLSYAPAGISQFMQAIPVWLREKLWIPDIIEKELSFKGKILFVPHHESHAASAFYPSPFSQAAFLTMDGVGEWDTASFGIGHGNQIEIIGSERFPHSLGLLYSAFTYYTGFRVNSGEYKLMGLAPYGTPVHAKKIFDELIDLKEDGSFKLNMKYFAYCYGLRMVNSRFEGLFGGPARKPESAIEQRHMDIAASIQQVTEEIILRMARHVHKTTGLNNLCLAGGVALNCVGNGRILREGPFKNLWIQPASGDAGGALGAALAVWYRYCGNKRFVSPEHDSQKASLLGPSYSDNETEVFLKNNHIPYKKYGYAELPAAVAELIAHGNVIGWFQGTAEFGPRALGNRSILGDSRDPQMQSKMNLKIKYRESFRPFAPSVLAEKAAEWFDLNTESPYMLLVAPVKDTQRLAANGDKEAQGLARLAIRRSRIPAVTHVDYSARIQTVSRQDNPLYYDLISAFGRKTGCPVLINTSFNVRGEPLVCSPLDAYACFMRTEIDYLVLGCLILDKKEQKSVPKDMAWQKQFKLD
ncbi:MAG: carbamoyltransferase [Candidatus Omnitrophota bacterium]